MTLLYSRMATQGPDPQETSNLAGMMKSVHQLNQAVCNIGSEIHICVSCFGIHAHHASAIYKCTKSTWRETPFTQLYVPDVASGI